VCVRARARAHECFGGGGSNTSMLAKTQTQYSDINRTHHTSTYECILYFLHIIQ